ncbi:MAG TPA: thiamine phosphate synthase [Capillimicrobium sp.]|nr:thiamine phosphate synthase [Capillimicrobium sp.]
MSAGDRRARLQSARLYFVCSTRPAGRPLREVLEPALEGGVDLFQLRDKEADDAAILEAAATARELCHAAGALFFVNDRPDLAVEADADGVHVGQDDMPVAQARALLGPERLVGLSTHSPPQVDGARDADLIGVGPVHPTPTKRWRPATGLDLLSYAAGHARQPWFAIGGIDASNARDAIAAGARRVAVVRAIAEAPDPRAAAYRLREMLDATPLDG